MMWLLAAVTIAGYGIGALPIGGMVAGVKGIDLRQHGSGKLGTTNVLRTIGKRAAALVLVGDFLKGSLAVWLARLLADTLTSPGDRVAWLDNRISVVTLAMVFAAFAAVCGHTWSLYMRLLTGTWGGGRGVATALGATLMIHPLITIIALAVGIPTIIISRYVSLGSILGALAGGAVMVALVVFEQLDLVGLLAVSLVVFLVISHRDNIDRLLRGTERKIGERAKS